MIDRESDEYKAAKDRVKVSWFTEQGYDITGLVHIGANDGYEIEFYRQMGIAPVLAFEPLTKARKIALKRYRDDPEVVIHSEALGNIDGNALFYITPGDGKGSTLMKPLRPEPCEDYDIIMINRWSSVEAQDIDKSRYNCCVIDVQGMELDLLRGMDEQIKSFDFFSVECSLEPIYKGEASVHEVIAYMDRMGFDCDTPMDKLPVHDDVFFINRRVKHPPAPPAPLPSGVCLNIGSGQRRFDRQFGWINVDCVSRPGQIPDLLCDVGTEQLPYPDESMNYVVLHHVYEHFGLGEGHALIREIHRVLLPGGSLIVTVPDMEALAKRWLDAKLEDFQYFVNVYGAYQGEPGDRHKWGYSPMSLMQDLNRAAQWRAVGGFDFRVIPGADIARDWWILGLECFK